MIALPVLKPTDPSSTIAELASRVEDLEQRLGLLQEFTHAGIFERDAATMQGRWDEHLYRIYGLPVPPPGTPAPDFGQVAAMILPEDRVAGGFAASMGVPGTYAARVRVRRPDGQIRHIHSQWKVYADPQGRPHRVMGVNSDQTEVFEASKRLEAAAEAARIGLWSTSSRDQRPSWNRRMFELFGLDPDSPSLPLGRWLRVVVHPDDRDAVARQILRWARSDSGTVEVEFRVRRPADGTVRRLVVRGRAGPGAVEGERLLEGIMLDVTEQHETMQRLRDTIGRAELANSALGLGTWEAEGEQQQVVWDEQMFRLRGVRSPRRAIDNDEVATYLHQQDRERVMASQRRRLLDGHPWSAEFRVVWPDGTVRWIASRSVPQLDESGREVRRIGLNFDITDAKLAEQALRDRELALAESRAKSRFMSRVSHELRTPLNAVLGFTQLMRDERQAVDAATQARWLGHVEDAGRHLLALIDDVLDLSRIDAGEMRLNVQTVRLCELVAGSLPLVSGLAQERQVHVDVSGRIDGSVQADPVRLRQVLLNLLSNAIKYNRRGGQVRLWTHADGASVTLAVADTGPGIPPEKLRDAFEPFNRLGAEAGTVEGTGIGLAVVKALVEQMGGRIDVDSRVGEGSVFSVMLAAVVPAKASVPEAAPDVPGSGPRTSQGPATVAARVLYVEDNPVNALVMSELLSGRPAVEFEVAADAGSGLARAIEWQPGLLLVDMQLPDFDGLELLRRLRADPRTAGIPCVALSANAMMNDVQAALDAGFVRYWTKPVNFDCLLAEMSELLGQPV